MKKILLSILSMSTIYFAQAQCEIFATVVNDSANCNQTVEIDLQGFSEVFVNELFTPTGPTDPNWVSTGGAQYDAPYIPSNDGGSYFWMGPSATTPTNLTTAAFDLSGASSGQICFEMVYADGNSGVYVGGPNDGQAPEQPDQYDEGVSLQYNIGGGWVDIVYYAPQGDTLPGNPGVTTPNTSGPGAYETWTNFCIEIPIAAFTSTTQFQWLQDNNSGACCDHWGLDDIQIVTTDPSYNIFFLNNAALVGPSPNSVFVDVTSDSSFFFLYSNGIDFCRDTVDMFVNPTTAHSQYTGSCDSIGYQLSVGGVEPSSVVSWSPITGLDNPNIQTPQANPVDDQMYIVTSDCGVDSTFVNVVPAFTPTVTASQDSICVGDVTLLTATTDQPTYNYTYEWTPGTVAQDSVAVTNGFPSINTTYIVTMITDSGCVRQDSVTIYVGAVPKTIDYLGDMRVCRGDSTQITVIPTQPTFFDDFELGANPSIWANAVNGLPNTDCGSVSGNALHFDGVGARGVELFPVDASLGGLLSFQLIYGSTFGVSPCSDMGFADVMSLEYSTNGGMTWTNITTYDAFAFDNWTLIQENIPVGAQTANTIFRLWQPINGGNDADNWAIDDFLLELNCTGTGCVQYSYLWSPATNVSDVTSDSPFFYPESSTYYSVAISPQGFNCNVAADSILVSVDELPLSISPSDTFLCEPNTSILLEASVPSECEYTLKMYDSFGDGWNGHSIDIVADGGNIGNFTLLNTPATQDSATVTFNINNGVSFDLVLNTGGFTNEVSFELYDHTGNLIFSDGPNPTIGVSFSSIANCQGTLYWTPNATVSNDSIPNPLVTPAVSTDYVIHVLNENNCLFTDTASVGVYQSNITLSNDISACFGDSIPLVASGADTYAWSPNIALSDSSIANPLSGTNVDQTYYVTYNTQGCEEIDSVSIDILNLPAGIINNNINPVKFCEGTTQELFVDNLNGWTFAWEDQNNNSLGSTSSIFVTEPGTYSISYNDGNCVNTDTVAVTESPNPVIDFTAVEKVLCCTGYDEEVVFTDIVSNTALANVYINGTEEMATSYTYSSADQNFVQLDHYRVVSTDGCEAEADLSIATKCLNPEFTNPDTVYVNTPVAFDLTTYDSGADNLTYNWSTTESGNSIADGTIQDAVFNGVAEDSYTADVEVTALYGSRTCTENAPSKDYLVLELKDPAFPDAFTPNGDGTNDYYRPVINVLASTTEMRVYNRWGDIVYDLENDASKLGWNGQWQNKDQPSDLYMYYIKVVHPDGREFLQEGSVSLIR